MIDFSPSFLENMPYEDLTVLTHWLYGFIGFGLGSLCVLLLWLSVEFFRQYRPKKKDM